MYFGKVEQYKMYDVVFTESEFEISLYIDGELIKTNTHTGAPNLYNIGFYIDSIKRYFQGDYLLHQHFNYAMTADEVATLYNNGDPMGYVVPKAMRKIDYSVQLTGITSYTWEGTSSPYTVSIPAKNVSVNRFYKVNVTVSNFEAGKPFIYAGIQYPIKAENGTYDIVIKNTVYTNQIIIYGGSSGTDRRLTLTVNSISPVGILAEYLPQNLMGQKEKPLQIIGKNSYTWDNVTTGAPTLDIRTDPGIKTNVIYRVNLTVSGFIEGEPYLYAGSRVPIPLADGTYDLLVTPSGNYDYISVYGGTNVQLKNLTITVNKVEIANATTLWLDSAKQLPLSDEYMEPLFQSIGGYDMAANGAPEILYNE